MLQLNLGFLKRPSGLFKPTRVRQIEQDQPFIWKHGITIHLVQRPRARRYLLRFQSDGSVRLVIPRRGSRAEGLRFLERSEAWLLKQSTQWQSRKQTQLPWTNGTCF